MFPVSPRGSIVNLCRFNDKTAQTAVQPKNYSTSSSLHFFLRSPRLPSSFTPPLSFRMLPLFSLILHSFFLPSSSLILSVIVPNEQHGIKCMIPLQTPTCIFPQSGRCVVGVSLSLAPSQNNDPTLPPTHYRPSTTIIRALTAKISHPPAQPLKRFSRSSLMFFPSAAINNPTGK